MPDVLVLAEQRDGTLSGGAREVVSVAARLAEAVGGVAQVLVIGSPGTVGGGGDLGRYGASAVTVAEHDALGDYHPEGYTQVVAEHVRNGDYTALLMAATTLGKDLAPRVAATLDVPLASDCTGIDSDDGTIAIVRPVYAGKAFATVEIDARPIVATLRPNAFPPTERPTECSVTTSAPSVDPSAWKVRVLERKQTSGGSLDVAEATVVVSGGRGMKDPSNWALLEGLRDALGSGTALGASRAVVDAGWRPHGEQVGQTGKTVAPKLYFAVGISGAVQHLAGMRTAKTIVAINRDADAPIFNVADYGIVGDLFEVVPRLSEAIAALKADG